MRHILIVALAGVVIACQPQSSRLGSPGAPMVVGYVFSEADLASLEFDQGLTELLGQKSGLAVELRAFPSVGALVEAIGAGEVHLAWLDPLAYLLAHERYGVEVTLVATRDGSPTRQGQIIAHADYGIVSLVDLKGADFCWLEPPTVEAVVMPRVFLAANGLDAEADLGEAKTFGSERELVQAVYDGECQAGATSVDARETILPRHPDALVKVKVIAKTAPVPHQVVGFSAGVPVALREGLTGTLLDVAQEQEVQRILGLEGLVPAEDDLFSELRSQIAAARIEVESLIGSPL